MTLVAASISLQLGSAALVKHAMSPDSLNRSFVVLAILIVLSANFGRLIIWNAIHKRYPISFAYPMSALFFPGVLLVAWLLGEPIGWMQVAGALTVMLGVILILAPHAPKPAKFPPDD
jgi:drug/metabolite transporter (DMT)-like permease